MKVTKTLQFNQEVEVEIYSDDISLILSEPETEFDLMSQLNDIGVFLGGVPKEIIRKMSEEQRYVVCDFMEQQAAIFRDI